MGTSVGVGMDPDNWKGVDDVAIVVEGGDSRYKLVRLLRVYVRPFLARLDAHYLEWSSQ